MGEKVLPLPRRRRVDLLQIAPSGRSLAIACALVLVAAGLYGLARETSMFAVDTIRVEGTSPALAVEVQRAVHRWEGHSLVTVDGSSVAQHVAGLPAVRAAVVDRAFPHTLRIRVIPEVPVAVLRRGPDSFLVSARGRVIAGVERGGHATLPRIWLPSSTGIELGSLLGGPDGGLAARSVAAFVGSGFAGRVSFVRALHGQITIGLRGGLELRLGAPVDLRLKISIAHAIVPALALPSQGGPDYLDIAVPERPVAGRNPQPGG
ncbi:MAG TPA: FtsQ-type POTRA domain-containing protein [Gaiellaceae bacterium]|jgi:cell division protein FtsQ|nr:FtsQ-type POTRA domain-containing protein [Gaiellaceae bacterium]